MSSSSSSPTLPTATGAGAGATASSSTAAAVPDHHDHHGNHRFHLPHLFHPDHHTPDMEAAVASLRAWRDSEKTLDADTRHFLSEATLRRYATARKGDAAAALDMLKGTVEWRKTAVVRPLACATCESEPTSHCFFPIGRDAHGNAVIYGNPPRASNTGVEATVTHVVHQLERCWDERESGAAGLCQGGQWVWVVDFRGFGFTHAMQARLGISFATTFANHFPERLRCLLLLNPPTVFSLLLSALQPFADQRTLSKVQTLTGDTDALIEQLRARDLHDEELLGWMRKVLSMPPQPGSLPPLPESTKPIHLPRIKLPGI
jgi:hypothetical protein